MYYVYILTTTYNEVFYVGVTNNLERRIAEHKSLLIPGFTKKYNITKLVYFESFPSPNDAITTEKKLKGLSRQKKINSIKIANTDFKDLSII